MIRQDKGQTKGSEPTTVGGGGAATSTGILFQQRVGALIGSWLLAERPLDHRLHLGQAKPVWVRFETEAPVDDILIKTSDQGFVAVQAKTNVSLSKNLDSEFGKTVSQFVRHWLSCRDGDGELNWNRPLDPQIDRLVLAIGPDTPKTVRIDLQEALRLKSQPGGGQLNRAQQRAFDCFQACFQVAWAKTTAESCSPSVIQELAALIRILTFDSRDLNQESEAVLIDVAEVRNDALGLLAGIRNVCAELMAQRGGIDRLTLRQNILGCGMRLRPPQDFQTDIAKLKAHSQQTAAVLKRFEEIKGADGKQFSIVRECQTAVREAALGGSLLVIGDPGAGKSGVLNALARDLMNQGNDVLVLAVDRHSVDTLEGLGRDLHLDHGLVKTLEAWDGTEPAWLVLDGLDAARGGPSGAVFRSLIENVKSLASRWKVAASIRTFDLRMGQTFQGLFKGAAPIERLSDQEFPNVRHVRVPPWTEAEFAQLLEKSPDLAKAMTNAPGNLRDVARVPFNTGLLNDLVKDGCITDDLSHVTSQAELLNLYWKHRVESHGAAAQACLLRIVKSMVENRVLRAPFEIAAKSDAAVLDALEGEGVLVSIDNRRGVQFRHHLLFDFAAARTLLDPQEIIDGRQRFGKPEAPGLMLAQALRFVLQEIWIRAPNRADFWTAVAHILAEKYGDPVIRSAGSRTCAEFPRQHEDTVILAQRIVSGDQKAAQAFTQICGAFGIRLEDEPHVELGPWVGLARGLAANVAPVCGSLRFLLFHLVGRVGDPKARCDLGIAARSLLDHAFSLESPGNLVAAAIDLVGETYASDMQQSRELLLRVFTPNRLDVHAAREVPGICQKIDKISRADPEFAVRIYRETFDFEVTDVQESYIGNSQILGLRSNTRQDYGMARHLLKKHFRTFLDLDPDHAIQAVVHAVEVYVDRKHPGNTNMLDVELSIGSCSVRLREDLSHIWAHDPESDYGDDAEALIKELLAHLRSADEAVVTRIAKRLVETASLAIFWSRLFLAASERKDKLLDFCLPIAMQQEFLTLRDTVKDAVDVVAGGYNRMSRPEREGFEVAVTGSDFSKLSSPDHARASMERRLFSKIGEANLITDRARAIAKEHGPVEGNENDRPFSVTLTTISPEPYHWIEDLDRAAPANQKLMKAIDRIKATFGIESDACHASDLTLEDSLREIEIFISEIDPQTQNPRLVIYAEGQISKCICHLVDRKQVPAVSESPENAERFCDLLLATVNSADPILDEDTEAKFENSASWGSPAPRVDAARAVLELTRQRPDLYPRFESVIDNLLQDLHPAVRLEAALYLVSIWDIDQAGFWRRLAERLAIEPNIGVLDHICSEVLGRVVHTDAERTEHLALDLLGRFECETDRCSRMRQCLSSLIAILSVMHQRQNSQKILESWIVDAAAYSAELSTVIHTLGEVFDAGLTGTSRPETAGFRLRSQEIVHDVVSAANAGLALHFQIDSPSVEQEDIGRKYALLLDLVCSQIFVAAKSIRAGSSREGSFDDHALAMFLDEVYDILEIIGKCAAPHTVHCLLQLTELLVPVNPARAFDLTMNAMLSGGRQTGYQFEAMGSDLLVKLMGQFLADHRELFEGEDRRTALIDSLELFMDAGWPSAQRLLYRLPELIQ